MKPLYIKPSKVTPEINFSPTENVFYIKGSSSPEDVRALYCPVIEWLEIFARDVLEGDFKYSPDNPLRFEFNLHYFNSSSAKFIYDMVMELKKLADNSIPVRIDWMYEKEDTDQREAGEEISELAGMSFRYIEIP